MGAEYAAIDCPARVTVDAAIVQDYPRRPELGGDGGFCPLLSAPGRWSRVAVWVRLPSSWNGALLRLWAESDGLRAPVASCVVDTASLETDSDGNFYGLALAHGPLMCDAWHVTGQATAATVGAMTGGMLSAQLWTEGAP